jgi:protoheme IX farnesyltransferase
MTTLEAALNPLTKIRFDLIADLFSLTKPRLSSLVIFTCALGLFLAPGEVSLLSGFISVFATWCLVGGACIINCYMERDIDSRMERTKNRPLPSGRIQPETALYLGIGLISLSLSILFFVINPLTAGLGLLATIVYVSFYTPLKRKTSWALFAGAVPGAIPPLMGWTSVTNSVDTLGLIIFAILFIWQLPHFLSISIYHAEDYNNADIKTFPAHIGFRPTQNRIVVYTFLLTLVSLGPIFSGDTQKGYVWGVYLLGGAFTAYSLVGYFYDIAGKEFRTWARRYFFGSLIYLPIVFMLMLYFRINIY